MAKTKKTSKLPKKVVKTTLIDGVRLTPQDKRLEGLFKMV